MVDFSGVVVVVLVSLFFAGVSSQANLVQSQRCATPATAPDRIEKVIATCQDEIKLAILQEALAVLQESTKEVAASAVLSRNRRDVSFTREEQRIAGCLLQCVYRKVKALDETGFPSVDGLVKLYAEGVTERGYYYATTQAVQQCLQSGHQQRLASNTTDKGGQMCDLAYSVFDCVSDRMGAYCAGN